MNKIDEAFYRLTVAQRDAAWRECEELRALLRAEHMGRLGLGHAITECVCRPKR